MHVVMIAYHWGDLPNYQPSFPVWFVTGISTLCRFQTLIQHVIFRLWLEVVSNTLLLENLRSDFQMWPIAWIERVPVTISNLARDLSATLKSSPSDQPPRRNDPYRSHKRADSALDAWLQSQYFNIRPTISKLGKRLLPLGGRYTKAHFVYLAKKFFTCSTASLVASGL